MSDNSPFVITRGERLILLTVGYLFLGATFYQHGKRLLRTIFQAGGAWRQRGIQGGAQQQHEANLRQQQAQLRQLQRQLREQRPHQQQPTAAGAAPGIA